MSNGLLAFQCITQLHDFCSTCCLKHGGSKRAEPGGREQSPPCEFSKSECPVSKLHNDFRLSRSSQPPPRTLSGGTTSTVVVFEKKKQLQYSQIRLSGHESPNTAQVCLGTGYGLGGLTKYSSKTTPDTHPNQTSRCISIKIDVYNISSADVQGQNSPCGALAIRIDPV